MTSKMKKIGAFLMSMVLILLMTAPTAYAADSVTITVTNAESATITYAQLIQESGSAQSGWEFVSDDVANVFISAFSVSTAEDAIWSLLYYNDSSVAIPSGVTIATITSSMYDDALTAAESVVTLSSTNVSANVITVSNAGLYLIKGVENGYTYSLMAAAVGTGDNFVDTTITAKKTSDSIVKTNLDSDNLAAYGDTVAYEITVTIPYIDPDASDRSFKIVDTLPAGAVWEKDGDGNSRSYVVTPSSSLGYTPTSEEMSCTGSYLQNSAQTDISSVNQIMYTWDFSAYVTSDNANAGIDLTIRYYVDLGYSVDNEYVNTVYMITGTEESATTTNTIYSTDLTITNYDVDGVTGLANAQFSVVDSNGDAITVTQGASGIYYYAGSGEDGVGTDTLTSGSDGTIVIYNLPADTYTVTQTVAPDGYKLNETVITADATYNGVATASNDVSVSITNTKLSSLPVTGGSGIVAAGAIALVVTIIGVEMFMRTKKEKER